MFANGDKVRVRLSYIDTEGTFLNGEVMSCPTSEYPQDPWIIKDDDGLVYLLNEFAFIAKSP